jgi:hypothetical protein
VTNGLADKTISSTASSVSSPKNSLANAKSKSNGTLSPLVVGTSSQATRSTRKSKAVTSSTKSSDEEMSSLASAISIVPVKLKNDKLSTAPEQEAMAMDHDDVKDVSAVSSEFHTALEHISGDVKDEDAIKRRG